LKKLFAQDIALLKWVGMHPVIVHGGGKEISSWLTKLGKETKFIDGLRYTDSETMEITEMILCGKINKDVVEVINQNGGKAVGLSGKDANIFKAKKIKSKEGQDLGQVGDIYSTDMTLVKQLCENGYIPVISSVAASAEGETLNLNADYVATGVAGALDALKLIFLTDVDGVMTGGNLLQIIELAEAKKLLNHPEVTGGMIPKIECAMRGIEEGVKFVHIINGSIEHAVLLEMFTDLGIGSMLVKNK
ncbi:MAG: acetylglutamate kinase, partial [Proteobacteria bacterium]|nr:acetylglutamate kinase [Pseudomonadota bacterium]